MHTPGSWTIEAVSDAVRIITRIPSRDGLSRKPGGIKVILARLNPPQLAEAETHCNARLMAAAPDLLEACKAVKAYYDIPLGTDWNGESASAMIQRVEAAIAKAEGRTK